MHPVLFSISVPFAGTEIFIYSVYFSMTFALILAIYLGTRAAQNEGLPVETALNMIFIGLIGLILGARIYDFFLKPSFYLSNPLYFIMLWKGSMATYGGVIGGVLGCIGYLRLKKQPVFSFLDAYIPYGFLGLGIIRVGDFLNGTAFGRQTDLPWGISFPKGSIPYNYHVGHGWILSDASASLPIHPTQLYSAITCFAICVILIFSTSKIRKFSGNRFLAGACIYMAMRLIIDYFREDIQKNLLWNLGSSQWVGIILICVIIGTWIYMLNRRPQES